ncbi:MAG: SpoIIE family protein phosphatase [Myxococcota bacterium]
MAPFLAATASTDSFEIFSQLVRAESLGDLMQRLSQALSRFDVEDFEVYLTSDGDEDAVLIFSQGRTSSTDGKIRLADHPGHTPMLGDAGRTIADEQSANDSVFHGASAGFALGATHGLQGLLIIYGLVAASVFEGAVRAELDAVIELFSVALHQIRRQETLQRSHQRARLKLEEFQEAQDILFLGDRREILDAVLARGLRNLGAMNGSIVLGEPGTWEIAHAVGQGGGDSDELNRMVNQCIATQSPGLINALSGEQTWSFDIDTIHIASIVVFPLLGRGRCIGVLVAIDATVSLDNIEMVQATTRAGATAIENWEVRQSTLQQQRLQEQMDLAAKAQQRLLPARDPNFRGIRLNHFSLYCDETGGDYVDAFTYERSGSVGSMLIGDVAGHGLGAAMLMVDLRARLRTMLRLQNPWSPHQILKEASSVLKEDSAPEEFVTLFLATVDARTGVMRYANAGHEPPLLYKTQERRWVELEATGVPLGLVDDAEYEARAVSLEPGDVLIAMTDGVTEAQAMDGEAFGTDAIRSIVESMELVSPELLMENMVSRTVAHRDRRAFNDDLTFLVAVVDEIGLRVLETPPAVDGEVLMESSYPSHSDAKDRALNEVEACLRASGREAVSAADIDALMLSCEEAMSNALIHGNGGNLEREMGVRVVYSEARREVTVIVADEGEGFDPRGRVIEHFDERALQRVSGRGLVIMANLVDRVEYWNGGRTVALTASV